MWRDNTNGLSPTGLLRPTDSSSAIRTNCNYVIIIINSHMWTNFVQKRGFVIASQNGTELIIIPVFFEIFLDQVNRFKLKQDCSNQGEALNIPTAFEGLWSSSNNIKTLYEIK